MLSLAALPGAAMAASPATTTFQVTATVVAACTVSASPLAFTDYHPTAASRTDGQTTMSVTCTNGAGYTIGLGAGMGTGASTTTRKMTSGLNTLNYSLYKTNAYSTVWGDAGGELVSAIGSGAAQNYTVYGRVPTAQTAPAGSYADTITVTVTF